MEVVLVFTRHHYGNDTKDGYAHDVISLVGGRFHRPATAVEFGTKIVSDVRAACGLHDSGSRYGHLFNRTDAERVLYACGRCYAD